MIVWLSVYDEKEKEEHLDFINELHSSLRRIEKFRDVPIIVIGKTDMDSFFHKNRLHDLQCLTDEVEKMIDSLPNHLKYHKNGWRRFMAFRSYPNEEIHSVTFRIA